MLSQPSPDPGALEDHQSGPQDPPQVIMDELDVIDESLPFSDLEVVKRLSQQPYETVAGPSDPYRYLPCSLTISDINGQNNANFKDRTLGAEPDVRDRWVDGLVAHAKRLRKKIKGPETDIPLEFLLDRNGDVTHISDTNRSIQPDGSNNEPSSYEPHFLIPDTCLAGLSSSDRLLRRIEFAIGGLIVQILTDEKPHASLSAAEVEKAYKEGIYPTIVMEFKHCETILRLWSPEFGEALEKFQNQSSGTNVAIKIVGGAVVAGSVAAGLTISFPFIASALGFGAATAAGAAALGETAIYSFGAGSFYTLNMIGLAEAAPLLMAAEAAAATAIGVEAVGAAALASAGLGGALVGGGGAAALTQKKKGKLNPKEMFELFEEVVRKESK
ncbi:hypothetical protein ABW19_dt0209088 [Dactylella cylindrospora]|nr:hypothetical protein ABW19_dt0209088 [Dactylella cylindrospora]